MNIRKKEGCCSEFNIGWIPLNSYIKDDDDNSCKIIPPSEYIYVGYDENDKFMQAEGGSLSISCNCTEGTGSCNPFFVSSSLFGTTWGCTGACKKCIQSQSGTTSNKKFTSGGYLNLTERTKFITVDKQLPAAFKAMFEVAEVKSAIDNFMKEIYQGLPYPELIEGENFVSVPKGYTLVFVNILGRAVILPVPTIAIPKTVGGVGDAAGAAVAGGVTGKCKCSVASSTGCKLNKVPIVQGYYCDSKDCSGTCTLTIFSPKSNGAKVINYAAICYKY